VGELTQLSAGVLAARFVAKPEVVIAVVEEWVSEVVAATERLDDDENLRILFLEAVHRISKSLAMAAAKSDCIRGIAEGPLLDELHFVGQFFCVDAEGRDAAEQVPQMNEILQEALANVRDVVEFDQAVGVSDSAARVHNGSDKESYPPEPSFLGLRITNHEAMIVTRFGYDPTVRFTESPFELFIALLKAGEIGLTQQQAVGLTGSQDNLRKVRQRVSKTLLPLDIRCDRNCLVEIRPNEAT